MSEHRWDPLIHQPKFILGETSLSCSNVIAVLLCAALVSPAHLYAEQPPIQPAKTVPVTPSTQDSIPAAPNRQLIPGGLRILVLEGQNVLNSLATKSAISPVVQVLDAVDQPVEGATVTFEVSPVGPGGTFGNQPIATTRTDAAGQATATLTPNSTPGSFVIKVTASFEGQTKEARIRQTNDANIMEAMLPIPPKPWFKSWKWWAVIGAGAGAGIATAMILKDRNNTPTITISPGTIVIGGSR